jgi:hypothetical protein
VFWRALFVLSATGQSENMAAVKPRITQTRWGKLATILSTRTDRDMHALIACLCVLFQVLRIEIGGMSERDLNSLDECGMNARTFYFQRRSLATLHEFGNVLREIDSLPSFVPLKAWFSPLAQKHWTRAIDYFQKYDSYIARLRNNVGGHFRRQAGIFAMESFLPDVTGKLELVHYDEGVGARLWFANEIAATSTLRHVSGKTSGTRSRKLVRHSVVAYRHAIWAVNCIVRHYLWGRFGA